MWGNVNGLLTAAVDKVKKLQEDIETQMDAAVGNEEIIIGTKVEDRSEAAEMSASTIDAVKEDDSSASTSAEISPKSTSDSLEEVAKTTSIAANTAAEVVSSKPKKAAAKKEKKDKQVSKITEARAEQPGATPTTIVEGVSEEEITQRLAKAKSEAEQALQQNHNIELGTLREKMSKMEEQFNAKYKKMEKDLAEKLNDEVSGAVSTAVSTALSELTTLKDGEMASLQKAHADQITSIRADHSAAIRAASLNPGLDTEHSLEEPLEETENFNEKIFTLEGKVAELEALLETKDKHLAEVTAVCASLRVNIAALESEVTLHKEVQEDRDAAKDKQVVDLEATVTAVEVDLTKLREVVADRERALETAASQLSDAVKNSEELKQKVADLSSEIGEKDARIRKLQIDQVDEGDMRKQLMKSQELLHHKQDTLAAYEQEGQLLAKKQSEMEKTVRNSKKEVRIGRG